jgi:hypothetical protein
VILAGSVIAILDIHARIHFLVHRFPKKNRAVGREIFGQILRNKLFGCLPINANVITLNLYKN